MIKLKEVLQAKKGFNRNVIKHTPLELNQSLSNKYGANIYLKREDLQIVRSYKIRGAFNFINSLSDDEKKLGVVCASAGNHAQGVALSCKELGIKSVIFMPQTTPNQKVRKTKKLGGDLVEIKLVGDNFDDAYKASIEFCEKNGSIFVHPFDDKKVITGQATIGLEIIEDDFKGKKIDMLLAPIGGGGLISGVGSIFKELSPETKIIGVESENSASMQYSIKKGKVQTLEKVDTFCDGVAVKTPGKNTFEITKKVADKFLQVPDGLTATVLLGLLDDQGIITEPSGALSIAGLELIKDEIKGKNIICIVSGGNFDFARLSSVEEKSLKYLGLKRYFIISFPQRPGALKDFLNTLGKEDDISFFEYIKKSAKENGPAIVGIETIKKENLDIFIEKMNKSQIKYEEITNNELYFDFLV